MGRLNVHGLDMPPASDRGRLTAYLRGPFRVLDCDGREIVISSARARALIVYLCLTPGHRATRDKLAETLWTPRAGRSALANLRQDLSVLQMLLKDIAPDALSIDNANVGLDTRHIAIDLVEEQAAIGNRATRLPEWVLRQSELLAGFKTLKSDFDDWLEGQRRDYASGKQEDLVKRTQRLGAARWTHADLLAEVRTLAEQYPAEQVFCQHLIQLLAISGTTTEINAALKRCDDAVRADGDELDELTRSTWQDAIGHVRQRQGGQGGFVLPLHSPDGPIRVEGPSARIEATTPLVDTICVGFRPIENLTGSNSYDSLAAQVQSSVLTDLQMLARPFSIIELPAAGAMPSARERMCRYIATPRLSIGKVRGVAVVNVEMSLVHSDLTNPRPSRIVHPLHNVLDDRLPLANRVASKLFIDLVIDQNSRLERAAAPNLSGAELVVRGLAMLNRRQNAIDGLHKALGLFSAAQALYENDVDALVGIAHTYHRLATQPSAGIDRVTAIRLGQIAVNRVLDIDPEHAQSMYVSAMIHSAMGHPDRAAASFDHLLSRTSHIKAMTYRGYNDIFLDRPKVGLLHIEESLEGMQDDPSMKIWHFFMGVAHFHCGDYAAAIRAMQESLLQDPQYMSARIWLAGCEHIAGDRHEAVRHAEMFRSSCPTYSLVDFATNWGEARTRNHAYLSRTQVMAEALVALELPQGR